MGKKADALQAELDELRESIRDNQSLAITLQRENANLRSEAMAAYHAESEAFRMVTDRESPTVRADIAKALGIVLRAGQQLTDEAILDAIELLRGSDSRDSEGHVATVKNDSLAQAVHHNKAERSTLLDSLTAARGIINRLAAALGVSQWDQEGSELVEKAQRWGVFGHWLKKRLNTHERLSKVTTPGLPDPSADQIVMNELAGEVRTIIAALMGEKELAKFLMSKPVVASKTLLDLAENQLPRILDSSADAPFTYDDLKFLWEMVDTIAAEPDAGSRFPSKTILKARSLNQRFEAMQSTPAADEFVNLMNVVILPLLKLQRARAVAT